MIEVIKDGSVISPKGFLAGGTYSGIKATDGVLDLGILISEQPAVAAATFTTNKVVSPSVTLSKERVVDGKARGVVEIVVVLIVVLGHKAISMLKK